MNLYVISGTTKGLGQALAARVAGDSKNFLVALSRAPEGAIPGGCEKDVAPRIGHCLCL